MYRYLKLVHLLGFALFLGSILSHIVTSRVHAGTADVSLLLFARDTVCIATRALTVPGLVLLIGSGIGMVWTSRGQLLRQRWVQLHVVLAAAIAMVSAVVVVAVARLAVAAEALAAGRGGLEAFVAPAAIERYAGAANILMILLAAGVALVRPRSGRPGAAAPQGGR